MAKPRHDLRRARDKIELALFTRAPASGDEVRRLLGALADQVSPAEGARVEELARVAGGQGDRTAYRDTHGVCGVQRFVTAAGAHIYLMKVETFPDHVNNVYLVCDHGRATLYDCGSQMAQSQEELRRAAEVVRKVWREPLALDDVKDVVLSHAHIDHFGGVGAWRGKATVHVHEFDARVITRFEERIVTAAIDVRVFLERSGMPDAERAELESMYVFGKQMFVSVPVDRRARDGDEVNGYPLHHAPGHCPGQICMQVHNVLLTTDHILPRITPHQSPESITPWTGLDHYMQALEKFRHIGGVDLALPGHEEPIPRLSQRIAEIQEFHRVRLEKVKDQCRVEPRNIVQIAAGMFGKQLGYGRLLALEEAAAHVEYLARRGELEIANLDDLIKAPNPVLLYRTAAA
jgi:glyoxylase-like metal-dependent hydrolase (beta-lactamase superfamily II)